MKALSDDDAMAIWGYESMFSGDKPMAPTMLESRDISMIFGGEYMPHDPTPYTVATSGSCAYTYSNVTFSSRWVPR